MRDFNRNKSILVFISYNKADKPIAREIALFLAAENINVWYDEWVISAGDSIVEQINKGLYGCTHFVIIWSKKASKSNWVRKELHSILAEAIKSGFPRILPIILDETPLPKLISDIRYIKYHGGLEKDREEIVAAITGDKPSHNFIKAVVKKYHEILYDPNADPEHPFAGLTYCPRCGSNKLEGSSATDYEHDETYYSITCKECGWSDWTQ